MHNKKWKSYKILLQHLKDTFPDLKVNEVMRDFELALKKAAEAVFPDAKVLGCNFHFAQVCILYCLKIIDLTIFSKLKKFSCRLFTKTLEVKGF